MKTAEKNARIYKTRFNGSDQFYLADPNKVTIKKNGGKRWGVLKEFSLSLEPSLEAHLNGIALTDGYGDTGIKGVVLPPIRKSDNKCIWAAIDIDGEVYNNDDIKIDLLKKVQELKLPLVPCFSKPTDTGNGIMLPFMKGVGNDFIKSFNEKKIITGDLFEFELATGLNEIDAASIKIELPKPKAKTDAAIDLDDGGLTKLQILSRLKTKTIEQHPSMGGKYHSWIQVVIAKAIKQGYGDNEILELIKQVHEDGRGIGYNWPESYQKQINYARGDTRLNKKNPGETKILEGKSFENAVAYEAIEKSYCYIMGNDMYNRFGTNNFYQDKQINNFHKHEVFIKNGSLSNKLLSSASFAKAEAFITCPQFPPGLIKIDKAGVIPLIDKGVVLNIYIPNYLQPIKGDVKFIIEFFMWLIGEDKWKIIEQWLAYMLQHPGVKMKWAVVLVSAIEGVGKGLLARICSRILGDANVNENANYKHLTNTHNTLLIGKQLLVLNEVSLGDFKSKQEGTNTLKNFVGDDIYSCNMKGKPMLTLPNLTNFMLFSNDERVLGAPQGGRRYFFCNITKSEGEIIQKSNAGFFDKAFNFADSDEGAAALLHYFKEEVKIVDKTIFKKRAPQTDDLEILIEQSKHPLQKKLEFDLVRTDGKNKIFDYAWSGLITFDELNEKLNTSDKDDTKRFDWGSFGDDAIYKFLSGNCVKWNNGDSTRQIEVNGSRQRYYILDDTRCPLPGKSYKDLTPKELEKIITDYTGIKLAIRNEEPNYLKAKSEIVRQIKLLKEWLADKKKKVPTYTHIKNRTAEEAYEAIIKKEIELIEDYPKKIIAKIVEYDATIKQQIRSPQQILYDRIYGTETIGSRTDDEEFEEQMGFNE